MSGWTPSFRARQRDAATAVVARARGSKKSSDLTSFTSVFSKFFTRKGRRLKKGLGAGGREWTASAAPAVPALSSPPPLALPPSLPPAPSLAPQQGLEGHHVRQDRLPRRLCFQQTAVQACAASREVAAGRHAAAGDQDFQQGVAIASKVEVRDLHMVSAERRGGG